MTHGHHHGHQDPPAEEAQKLIAALKAEVAPIVNKHAHLQIFANEHCCVRYLRARSWHLQKASKMLKATLEWRLDYKPHLIHWEEVKDESLTGKHYVYHVTDKAGRPIVLMRPRNQNTKDTEKQVRHLIYTLEAASRQADKSGVGKFAWLLDFGGYTMSNAPPLKVSLYCNSVLANHYPERLGLAVCYHAPMLFSMTWKAVQPFIDPVTKQKIVFIDKNSHEAENMAARFDMEQIESFMGGQIQGSAYDHAKYGERMALYDKEVAEELEHVQRQLQTAASAADHKVAHDNGIQGITETAEQPTAVVAAS